MRIAIAAVVCLVCGWYAHVLWTSPPARVTVTVEPAAPKASVPSVVRPAPHPAPQARKTQTTPLPAGHGPSGSGLLPCQFQNGVLDTCAGNGYVTPGIGYYSPPT
jgi:hypothetical protein